MAGDERNGRRALARDRIDVCLSGSLHLVNWPKAIADEILLVWKMTFSNGGFFARGRREDWTKDRHLRNGFLLAIPVFFVPVLLFNLTVLDGVASVLAMFGFAILSNLVWLGFAAWSRARSSEPGPTPK